MIRFATLAVLSLAAATMPALAAPPTNPSCIPLAAGSTGIVGVGGRVPSPEQLEGRPGGFGQVAPTSVAKTLPSAVAFKSTTETFGLEYAFAVRGGRIYVARAAVGRLRRGERWHVLELPDCLNGQVSAISADYRLLLALGPDRQLYSHDMPGGDLSPTRWTWRWGPYFWTGPGLRMFRDVRQFAASDFQGSETFTDTAGRSQHPLGVGTVYLLRGDGRRITYLDPWLPTDDSREVCAPGRGTIPLTGLDGAGSTVFVAGQRGELFTRLYDFDVSGANKVLGDYSWQRDRAASDMRWQLPGPDWVRQPSPPGSWTDRVSIARTGPDASQRLLRVEGRDPRGRVGYWEKSLRAVSWQFVATGGRITGRPLPLPHPATLAPPETFRFQGVIGGAQAVVSDFAVHCSPASLRIELARGVSLDLVLHSVDGLRQDNRARGLDDTPRAYDAAIEVPQSTWAAQNRLDPRVRAWIKANLGSRRISAAPLAVTSTALRFTDQCWSLTRDGGTAQLGSPPVPLDIGAVVAGAAQEAKNRRAPGACAP